jgi:hypothetical protein
MNDYYPLGLDWWAVGLIALAFTGVGVWAYLKDGVPHSLGNMALPVAFVTAFGWFTDLPESSAWIVASVTAALWFVGMLMPSERDDPWHFGALAVAWLGKLVASTLPWVWAVLTGQVTVPLVVLLALVLAAVIGIAGWRSERVRSGYSNLRHFARRRRARTA